MLALRVEEVPRTDKPVRTKVRGRWLAYIRVGAGDHRCRPEEEGRFVRDSTLERFDQTTCPEVGLRTVTVPCAIDLAFDVATDIGLAYLENDWITVTYLWECEEVGDDDTAGDDDTSADDDTGDDDTAADDDGDDDGTEDEGSAPKVGDRVGGCSCRLPGSA